MQLVRGFFIIALALIVGGIIQAGVILSPYEAPEWNVSEWINGDPGPLRNQRGRVLVIEFFQLWCPGCNEFSGPLMKEWNEKWADRDDIMVVSIHTVFEGHDVQTPARLREYVREKGIKHIVGIDKFSSANKETPITMDRFNTGGTPHVAIVDKEGDLRFSHFGKFDAFAIEAFVERLTKERGSGVRPGPKPELGTKQPTQRNRPPRGNQAAATDNKQPPTIRRGGRPNPADKTGAADSGEKDGKDAAKDLKPGLSGRYQMQFQQKSKSCGTRSRPLNLPVDITVDESRIVAKFEQRFAGMNQFTADFDPATGNFNSKTMRRADENGVGVSFNIQLHGRMNLKATPPKLQFQFTLDKEGDEPGWDCKITGSATATKSNRLR